MKGVCPFRHKKTKESLGYHLLPVHFFFFQIKVAFNHTCALFNRILSFLYLTETSQNFYLVLVTFFQLHIFQKLGKAGFFNKTQTTLVVNKILIIKKCVRGRRLAYHWRHSHPKLKCLGMINCLWLLTPVSC